MTAVLPVRRPGAASALPPAGDIRSAAARWAGLTRRILGRVTPWLVRGILGLAIVARIVSRHSGTITLGSERGEGTTATITLPSYVGKVVNTISLE